MIYASTHKALRAALEAQVVHLAPDYTARRTLVDSLMRAALGALEAEEQSRAELHRQFTEFQRDPDAQAPSWAYRTPGSRPQCKPLR